MRALPTVTRRGTRSNVQTSSRERSGNGESQFAQAEFKEKAQARALARTDRGGRARPVSATEGGPPGSPGPQPLAQKPSSGRIWAKEDRAAPRSAARFDGSDFTP
jgi:hypothetical protein